MYMAHSERKLASANLTVPFSTVQFACSVFISDCTNINKFSGSQMNVSWDCRLGSRLSRLFTIYYLLRNQRLRDGSV